MGSSLDRLLHQLRPEKRLQALRYRPDADLPFVDEKALRPHRLLIDSCVYVDAGKGKLPAAAKPLLEMSQLHHCSVCLAELAHGLGMLDPRDARTKRNAALIKEAIARAAAHRTVTPDEAAWLAAGIATGILARLQRIPCADRRKLLNDALILFAARKRGLTLLTANIRDFDLLGQLVPDVRLLFYRPA